MSEIELTPEFLADLKEKAETATPGPWEKDCINDVLLKNGDAVVLVKKLDNHFYPSAKDAAYIAAANPQVVLGLLDFIDDLRSEILAYQAGCETIRCPRAKEFSDEN